MRAPHFSGKRPLIAAVTVFAVIAAPLALIEDAGAKPFAQTDWPNPTVSIKVQTPFQVGNPLTLLEDAGEKPFFQTEWPDPPPVVIQTPFQHQKHSALESVALSPTPVSFPRAQQPYQLQKAIVLFEPCDFGLTGFISTTPTDISTTISENIDILGTISENIDVRGLISTDTIDLTTAISENIDLFTTICET